MKVFMFFINTIYWLWLFIVPILITGIPAFLLYQKSADNLPWCIALVLTGVIAGIYFAERVRKTKGLASFFSSIATTPDIKDQNH